MTPWYWLTDLGYRLIHAQEPNQEWRPYRQWPTDLSDSLDCILTEYWVHRSVHRVDRMPWSGAQLARLLGQPTDAIGWDVRTTQPGVMIRMQLAPHAPAALHDWIAQSGSSRLIPEADWLGARAPDSWSNATWQSGRWQIAARRSESGLDRISHWAHSEPDHSVELAQWMFREQVSEVTRLVVDSEGIHVRPA